jgi:hypothetical protein
MTKLTFIVGLGAVDANMLRGYAPAKIKVDTEEHDLPMYLIGGSREECIQRITDDINRFFDEVDKDFQAGHNKVGA